MKYSITGYKSGLGKELYKRLGGFGIDKVDGKDITKPDVWIHEALDTDVFINNAYDGFSQINLLEMFFKEWKESNKVIVNVSSCAADLDFLYEENLLYPIHKRSLEDACVRLQNTKSNVRILNIKVGWMDTPMSSKFTEEKMSTEYVASKIIECINDKNVKSITIGDIGSWKSRQTS